VAETHLDRERPELVGELHVLDRPLHGDGGRDDGCREDASGVRRQHPQQPSHLHGPKVQALGAPDGPLRLAVRAPPDVANRTPARNCSTSRPWIPVRIGLLTRCLASVGGTTA
jgi:hypothetical protein